MSPLSPSDPVYDSSYASPSRHDRRDDTDESGRESSRRLRSNTWESEDDAVDSRSRNKRFPDELEEGEASDEEDSSSAYNQRASSKRRSNDNDGDRSSNSPRTVSDL